MPLCPVFCPCSDSGRCGFYSCLSLHNSQHRQINNRLSAAPSYKALMFVAAFFHTLLLLLFVLASALFHNKQTNTKQHLAIKPEHSEMKRRPECSRHIHSVKTYLTFNIFSSEENVPSDIYPGSKVSFVLLNATRQQCRLFSRITPRKCKNVTLACQRVKEMS